MTAATDTSLAASMCHVLIETALDDPGGIAATRDWIVASIINGDLDVLHAAADVLGVYTPGTTLYDAVAARAARDPYTGLAANVTAGAIVALGEIAKSALTQLDQS